MCSICLCMSLCGVCMSLCGVCVCVSVCVVYAFVCLCVVFVCLCVVCISVCGACVCICICGVWCVCVVLVGDAIVSLTELWDLGAQVPGFAPRRVSTEGRQASATWAMVAPAGGCGDSCRIANYHAGPHSPQAQWPRGHAQVSAVKEGGSREHPHPREELVPCDCLCHSPHLESGEEGGGERGGGGSEDRPEMAVPSRTEGRSRGEAGGPAQVVRLGGGGWSSAYRPRYQNTLKLPIA